MKILFDQNMPWGLRKLLEGHECTRLFTLGWSQLKNGDLLSQAEIAGFDLFLTGDQQLRYQQNLSKRRIAIIEVTTVHWPSVQLCIGEILGAIEESLPGSYKTLICQQLNADQRRLKEPTSLVAQISIIIPALNEAESIGHVVAEMPWHQIAECIVVDNGSTDETAEIARARGARVVQSARGYGAACLAGSHAALVSSDILVYMDGDGSDVIADLERLTGPIAAGEADFVLGSRIQGKRAPGSMLPSQVFAGHMVGFLLRYLQGVRYTDMGPFRAIRRSSLESLGMSELTYGWNLEMQIKAAQHGLRIREITVDYRARFGGVSKVSGDWKASIKAATRIMEVLFRVGLHRRRV